MNDIRFAAIDFETAYWGPGSACSLGIVVSDGERIVDEWYHLIHPLYMTFNPGCVMVNGIHPADVAEEDPFPAFWEEIDARLEGALVFAHNASFDTGVLASALTTYQLPAMHFRHGDTVALSRKLWKDLPNHKLDTVAGALGFDFHHHQALDDARACAFIVAKALQETGLPTVEALMKATGQRLKPFPKIQRPKQQGKGNREKGKGVETPLRGDV